MAANLVLDLLHKSSLALVNPSVEVNELVLSQEVYYFKSVDF